jgi:hypothetical protein
MVQEIKKIFKKEFGFVPLKKDIRYEFDEHQSFFDIWCESDLFKKNKEKAEIESVLTGYGFSIRVVSTSTNIITQIKYTTVAFYVNEQLYFRNKKLKKWLKAN